MIAWYQHLIGILQWGCELGRLDMLSDVALMIAFNAALFKDIWMNYFFHIWSKLELVVLFLILQLLLMMLHFVKVILEKSFMNLIASLHLQICLKLVVKVLLWPVGWMIPMLLIKLRWEAIPVSSSSLMGILLHDIRIDRILLNHLLLVWSLWLFVWQLKCVRRCTKSLECSVLLLMDLHLSCVTTSQCRRMSLFLPHSLARSVMLFANMKLARVLLLVGFVLVGWNRKIICRIFY